MSSGGPSEALGRWWRRRTLHTRLALLVTGAVAVAVVTLAGLAWATVGEIMARQSDSQLSSDANAIAAQPDEWRAAADGVSQDTDGPHGGGRDGHRQPRDLGQRWQILDSAATVVSGSTRDLPGTTGARRVALGQRSRMQESINIGPSTYEMLTVPATGGGAVQVAINRNPDDHTLATFGMLLAAGCIAGIGGAALLGRAVARRGLVPVQQLTSEVEDVAVTMDLGKPITISGDDEIARLGRSVNTMLAAIDTSRRAQRTLVEDAGHELRTPLTSLRTNIELLLSIENQPELAHRLPPDERAKLLHDLDTQVAELGTLTAELVELARED